MILVMALLPSLATAQQKTSEGKSFLSHISVGASYGTNGLGLDVATPLHRNVDIRAGVNFMALGTFHIKMANNLQNVYSKMDYPTEDIPETMKNRPVEMGINLTQINGQVLVDYYPWKSSCFHLTGGLMIGNNNVMHVFNTEDGSVLFLNQANSHVQDYNYYFNTTYPAVGIPFGKNVFTADENGNIDARMRVWTVRPYIGIGWGRNYATEHFGKFGFNCDIGYQLWGHPEFVLNNGEKIVKSSDDRKESGVFGILSGFDFWPTIRLRVSFDVYKK